MNRKRWVVRLPCREFTPLPSNHEKDARVNRWTRIRNSDAANIPVVLMVFGLMVAAKSLATAGPVPHV